MAFDGRSHRAAPQARVPLMSGSNSTATPTAAHLRRSSARASPNGQRVSGLRQDDLDRDRDRIGRADHPRLGQPGRYQPARRPGDVRPELPHRARAAERRRRRPVRGFVVLRLLSRASQIATPARRPPRRALSVSGWPSAVAPCHLPATRPDTGSYTSRPSLSSRALSRPSTRSSYRGTRNSAAAFTMSATVHMSEASISG
jgi:hypothetical protein